MAAIKMAVVENDERLRKESEENPYKFYEQNS